MRTSKPFSTISYNSLEFLNEKLGMLLQKRLITFYAFVKHYPEEDERKEHKHLYIIPNGQIDTDSVTDYLQEMDLTNPLKPLGVMPWQSSKWADWFLYTSHDTAYLASKNQTRKYHYTQEDFVTSHDDFFLEQIHTIDRTKYIKTQEFVDQIKSGATLFEMVAKGQIPAPQFLQYSSMYSYIKNEITERNGRVTHSPNVDKETGEIIDDE